MIWGIRTESWYPPSVLYITRAFSPEKSKAVNPVQSVVASALPQLRICHLDSLWSSDTTETKTEGKMIVLYVRKLSCLPHYTSMYLYCIQPRYFIPENVTWEGTLLVAFPISTLEVDSTSPRGRAVLHWESNGRHHPWGNSIIKLLRKTKTKPNTPASSKPRGLLTCKFTTFPKGVGHDAHSGSENPTLRIFLSCSLTPFQASLNFPQSCHCPMIDALLEILLNLPVHIIQLFCACGLH